MVKNPVKKSTETSTDKAAVVPAAVDKGVVVPATDKGEVVPAAADKNTSAPAATNAAPAAVEPKKIDLTKPPIKDAIAQGLALIKEGKTKADAARAMYAVIKAEPKEVIIAAFVAGATLTEKGAQTYWYNCKRRAEKKS